MSLQQETRAQVYQTAHIIDVMDRINAIHTYINKKNITQAYNEAHDELNKTYNQKDMLDLLCNYLNDAKIRKDKYIHETAIQYYSEILELIREKQEKEQSESDFLDTIYTTLMSWFSKE